MCSLPQFSTRRDGYFVQIHFEVVAEEIHPPPTPGLVGSDEPLEVAARYVLDCHVLVLPKPKLRAGVPGRRLPSLPAPTTPSWLLALVFPARHSPCQPIGFQQGVGAGQVRIGIQNLADEMVTSTSPSRNPALLGTELQKLHPKSPQAVIATTGCRWRQQRLSPISGCPGWGDRGKKQAARRCRQRLERLVAKAANVFNVLCIF